MDRGCAYRLAHHRTPGLDGVAPTRRGDGDDRCRTAIGRRPRPPRRGSAPAAARERRTRRAGAPPDRGGRRGAGRGRRVPHEHPTSLRRAADRAAGAVRGHPDDCAGLRVAARGSARSTPCAGGGRRCSATRSRTRCSPTPTRASRDRQPARALLTAARDGFRLHRDAGRSTPAACTRSGTWSRRCAEHDGGALEPYLVILPMSDVEVRDDWRTAGMVGHGQQQHGRGGRVAAGGARDAARAAVRRRAPVGAQPRRDDVQLRRLPVPAVARATARRSAWRRARSRRSRTGRAAAGRRSTTRRRRSRSRSRSCRSPRPRCRSSARSRWRARPPARSTITPQDGRAAGPRGADPRACERRVHDAAVPARGAVAPRDVGRRPPARSTRRSGASCATASLLANHAFLNYEAHLRLLGGHLLGAESETIFL